MKRFLLFASPTHYASGGLKDLVGAGDTVEQAKEHAELRKEVHLGLGDWYCRDPECSVIPKNVNWWYVFDTHELRIVEGSAEYPYQLEIGFAVNILEGK